MSENSDREGRERRVDVALMGAKLNVLHQDVGEIKDAIKELTSAITRLALVEERIASTSAAQERAFEAIAKVEARLVEIEKMLPEYSKVSIWVDRGIWAALAAAAVYAAKKVGLA
jgi:regulator of replication initiation timing